MKISSLSRTFPRLTRFVLFMTNAFLIAGVAHFVIWWAQ